MPKEVKEEITDDKGITEDQVTEVFTNIDKMEVDKEDVSDMGKLTGGLNGDRTCDGLSGSREVPTPVQQGAENSTFITKMIVDKIQRTLLAMKTWRWNG